MRRCFFLSWMVWLLFCLAACGVNVPPAADAATPALTLTPQGSPAETPSAQATAPYRASNADVPLPGGTATPPVFYKPTCTWCVAQTAIAKTPSVTPTPAFQAATVNLEKLDVWDHPSNENSYWHRQTQLIMGEPVLVVGAQAGWAKIVAVAQPSHKDSQGYPGWVRQAGLVTGWQPAGESLVVVTRSSQALAEPAAGAKLLARLTLDTSLPVISKRDGWVEARLPDGRSAWLTQKEVRLTTDRAAISSTSALLTTAASLVGSPYLWGGTTPDAPDCSGILYRLFHAYGILLPRDADDQALVGVEVALEKMLPGDLIFYQDNWNGPVTHVGMAMGSGKILDANPWLGLSIHPIDDMRKYYIFHSIRRILK